MATQKRKDEEAKLLSEAKHAEREKVAQGKKPFFMKKGAWHGRHVLTTITRMRTCVHNTASSQRC